MAKKKAKSDDTVRPLSKDIDKLIHEPARLMIMSYLYVIENSDFIFLRSHTGLTDGNLSSHLSKLESAGYVDIKKRFKGKKPQTLLKLSQKGREAFEFYRKKMEQVLGGLSQK